MEYEMYTDGGARGNPGPGGAGIVIKNKDTGNITKLGFFLGQCTNNEAEYQALMSGLEEIIGMGDKNPSVICHLDSLLIVKQLNGEYKVKDYKMKKYWLRIKEMEKNFDNIKYKHIKREQNTEADELVNKVLDLALDNSTQIMKAPKLL